MKGIKECINWMLDNPMKVLSDPDKFHAYRYNNENIRIELKIETKSSVFKLAECYEVLIDGDWKEVKQPYTFLEAYEDCKENKNNYHGEKYDTDRMATDSEGKTYMYTMDTDSNAVYLDQGWLKED